MLWSCRPARFAMFEFISLKITNFSFVFPSSSTNHIYFITMLITPRMYLLQIPSDRELCVNVTFEREDFVGAVQAVPVNVYDYYEPGQS